MPYRAHASKSVVTNDALHARLSEGMHALSPARFTLRDRMMKDVCSHRAFATILLELAPRNLRQLQRKTVT